MILGWGAWPLARTICWTVTTTCIDLAPPPWVPPGHSLLLQTWFTGTIPWTPRDNQMGTPSKKHTHNEHIDVSRLAVMSHSQMSSVRAGLYYLNVAVGFLFSRLIGRAKITSHGFREFYFIYLNIPERPCADVVSWMLPVWNALFVYVFIMMQYAAWHYYSLSLSLSLYRSMSCSPHRLIVWAIDHSFFWELHV